jgi:uncharacterized protein YbaR (Trm112 family)
MSSPRTGLPGATRVCPHCKETVLESAAVCPACRHHLRYDEHAASVEGERITPLRVEGSIRHPSNAPPWEYSVVVTVRNERGDEIARKLISVGAMHPDDVRSFALSVEVTPARGRGGRGTSRH